MLFIVAPLLNIQCRPFQKGINQDRFILRRNYDLWLNRKFELSFFYCWIFVHGQINFCLRKKIIFMHLFVSCNMWQKWFQVFFSGFQYVNLYITFQSLNEYCLDYSLHAGKQQILTFQASLHYHQVNKSNEYSKYLWSWITGPNYLNQTA